MPQTRFAFTEVSEEKKNAFDSKLTELYQNIKTRFKQIGTFQKVLIDRSKYGSFDLVDEQEPEQFAKHYLIQPLLDFLGYTIIPEIAVSAPKGRRKPDYLIRPIDHEEPVFYVEAEPINTELDSEGHGIRQVREWIVSRTTKTDYGIATDGIKWIVVKYNPASTQPKKVHEVDLRNIFLSLLDPSHNKLLNMNAEIENAKTDFLKLSHEYVLPLINNYLEEIEEKKEAISKRFYNEYVENVFGYDKNGVPIKGLCLTKKVKTPFEATQNDINLFSVVLMNRLIFVKFLEDKGIVDKDFLKALHGRYKKNPPLGSFYKTYLDPLFYECFNKSNKNRPEQIQADQMLSKIPYLNGGLFREIIPNERLYDIENEGIDLVIDNIFTKYSFGSDADIDPDILGYIFEKTINYISGTGATNQQKMKGAYYTPDDVVSFLIKHTLIPVIFEKMIKTLRSAGWKESDLAGYSTLDDLLETLPNNPIFIDKMVEAISTVRALDPACGSGHFLTALLSVILRVKESLLIASNEKIDRHKLKKEIISENIFGIDIDRNAVEIARLRLWLSLIEDVADKKHIDTLPNIDFHVVSGNSLVGWLNEPLEQQSIIDLTQDAYISGVLQTFEVFYPQQIQTIRKLLSTMRLQGALEAYEILSEIYDLESGEKAVGIRLIVEKIRNKLYNVINSAYLGFVNQHTKLKRECLSELNKNLPNRDPFHWNIDFEKVLANSGFDVIVGNPPYIEDGNYPQIDPSGTDLKILKLSKNGKTNKANSDEPLFYESRYCGNTHAYFIERSVKLLNKDGKFGFIVPVSLVSTQRMSSIRRIIQENSSKVKYFNFDDRPSKIFSGIEHCRSTIVVTTKGKGVHKVTTSKFLKWHAEDRGDFLKNLKTTNWSVAVQGETIPKIGTSTEREIITKLVETANGKTVTDVITSGAENIWYYNATSNWIHAHIEQFVPKVEYYPSYTKRGKEIIPIGEPEKRLSSHYMSISIDQKYQFLVNGLLNTSLFYWWFVIWADGRDLLKQNITSFPLDTQSFSEEELERIKSLVTELMQSYEDTSHIQPNTRKDGKYIVIKEIRPKYSKSIIDQIDDLFAGHFGFNEAEKGFIRNFDLKFRIEEE